MKISVLQIIIISYLVGFGFLLLIRSYDKYDKEPLWRMILLSFFGGFVSIMASSLLYVLVHPQLNFTDAILKVGTVEEFSKLLTLFVLYKIFRKEFDEIVDGIIYVAAVSLGFSVIENIFYAQHAAFPVSLLFKRFLFATVGHISFSVYMGIAFYVHKKIRKNYVGLFLSFVLATLAHGLYDGFLFNRDLTVFFLPLYFLLIIFQFRLLHVAYAYSKMKGQLRYNDLKVLNNNTGDLSCCNCLQNDTKLTKFKKAEISICNNCNHLIISKKDFNRLLKYYRPKLNRKTFFKMLDIKGQKVALNKEATIIFHTDKERLNTGFEDLNDWLYYENKKDLKKYHRTLEGRIFYHLGFKYLS